MEELFRKRDKEMQKPLPPSQITKDLINYWADFVTKTSWKEFDQRLNKEIPESVRKEFIRKKVRSCLTKRRRAKNLKLKRKDIEINSQKAAIESNKKDDINKFVTDSDKKIIYLDNDQVEISEDKIGRGEAIKLEKVDIDSDVKFIGDGFKLIRSKVLASDPRLRNKETFILANDSGLTLPFQIINMNTTLPNHVNNTTLELLKNDIQVLRQPKYNQSQRKHLFAYLFPTGEKSGRLHAQYGYESGKMKMMHIQKFLSQSAFIITDALKNLMTTEKVISNGNEVTDSNHVRFYYETPHYLNNYLHTKLTIPIVDKIIMEILRNPNSMCYYMLAKLLTLLLAYKFKCRNIISFPLVMLPSAEHLSEFDLGGQWLSYMQRFQLIQERLKSAQGQSDVLEQELHRNIFGKNETLQERCKTEGIDGTKLVWYEFFVNRIYPDWTPMASDCESGISSDEESMQKNFKQLDHSIMVCIIEIPKYVQALQQFTEDVGISTAAKMKDLFKIWTRQTIEHEGLAINVGPMPRVIDIDDDTLFSVLSQNAEVRPDLIRYADEVTSSDTDIDKAEDKYYNQNPRDAIAKAAPTKIENLHRG